jgi:antitoxin MazE
LRAVRAIINRWGNSLALRLPRQLAEEARLHEGASVELALEQGVIKITPARKRFELAELLSEERPGEVGWGEPVGDEIW